MSSPRAVAMEKIRDLASKVRNGSYFVKRGPIDWAAFPFSDYPRAIAIMIDSATFVKMSGQNEAQVALEMFLAVPESSARPQIDDGLMDELIADAESIVLELMRAKDSADFPVVFRLSQETASFVEAHDMDMGVQGIIVNFTIVY
jgi:hypothetical protein